MTENEAIQQIKKIYIDTNESDKCIALKMAISALIEIQKYKKIGGIEECREAREKQIPKKPILIIYTFALHAIKSCCKELLKQEGTVVRNAVSCWIGENHDLFNRRQEKSLYGVRQQNLQETYILVQASSSLAFGRRCEAETL